MACYRKTISLQLTPASCGWRQALCAARVMKNKPYIPSVNTSIIGELFTRSHGDYKGFCLSGGVFDFLSCTHDLSFSQARPRVEQLLPVQRQKKAEGVKREPTDPHKQALSFMASVTPSLQDSDSQTFKHHWSAPLPCLPTPSNSSPSPTQFTHSTKALS